MLDKLFGLHQLKARINIWFLLGGCQTLENLVSNTAIIGLVPYMLYHLMIGGFINILFLNLIPISFLCSYPRFDLCSEVMHLRMYL